MAKRKQVSQFQQINDYDIENMLYTIGAFADKKEAKRFSKLDRVKQQKVTLILKSREARARRVDMHIDVFLVREVINDAQNNVFIDLE